MINPLHPSWPCDAAVHQVGAAIVENVLLAKDTRRLRIACPQIARSIVPGQFVMLRLTGFSDPLLGRALALYDVVGEPGQLLQSIDVVYLVKGKFTSRLAEFLPGQRVDIWGPLGNGFPPVNCEHLILVAGGIGQTPFLAMAREFLGQASYGSPARQVSSQPSAARKVTFCYGARSAEYLAGLEDFARLGIDVRISTDDGSHGRHGFVTDLLAQVLEETDASGSRPQSMESRSILCCGPEPMMERVAKIAAAAQVPCQVSLEAPMACGIGVCFTCVAKVTDDSGGWDYKRTCVEGPVFDAARICWD